MAKPGSDLTESEINPAKTRLAMAVSYVAISLERLALLILPLALVISAFLIASWFGLFRAVPDVWRIAIAVGFGLTALASLWPLRFMRWPGRENVVARLERENELLHRPITTQEDTLATGGGDAFSAALWRLHQKKMSEKIGTVTSTRVRTDVPKRDPFALRVFAPLLIATGFAFSFGSNGGQVGDAFRSHVVVNIPPARIDAWITPPNYTGIAPIFLTSELNSQRSGFTAPEGSEIKVRIADGSGTEAISWPASTADFIEATEETAGKAKAQEFSFVLESSGQLVILADGAVEPSSDGQSDDDQILGQWTITMDDDLEPEIAFAEEEAVERAVNGALTLRYATKDDYRVRSARGEITLLDTPEGTRDQLPLYEAPELSLTLPRRSSEDGSAKTTRDLTEHPWAGATVELTLIAEDDLGQIGRSEAREIQLPGRPFSNPLARAIIEQRRNLALDAHQKRDIVDVFDVLMLYPDETIDNPKHFLGLTTIRTRLWDAQSEEKLREVVDYMWEVARQIEDGDLSDAEKRLQEAQQALREALERGASDEEIAALMDELRDAMQEFLREFAERAAQDPNFAQNQQQQQNGQQMDQNTLEEMLDRMQDLAESGAREQALAMLDQLQDMMNNLQMAQPQQGGQQGQSQAQQQMNELGEILREQQRLMDETFRQNRRGDQQQQGEGQQGQQGQQNQGQQPGQSQGENGQQGQQGQQPGEQGGQQGEGQQPGQGQGQAQTGQGGQGTEGLQGLAPGQQALRDRLDEFMDGLRGMGVDPGSEFDDAGRSMGQAGEALEDQQGEQALGDQGEALDALREGANNMMQQLQEMQQAQQGQQGGQGDPNGTARNGANDPLGRPQRSSGPDFGEDVEVPDEIDTRRAREILEAIRRRLGDALSPALEKEYLERLLELN